MQQHFPTNTQSQYLQRALKAHTRQTIGFATIEDLSYQRVPSPKWDDFTEIGGIHRDG